MTLAVRCADLSERAGEQLGATATTAESWLLVVVNRSWARDVGSGDGLADAPRRAALAWLERTPSSRLLFVRRPGGARASDPAAFVVSATEVDGEIRRLSRDELERLAVDDEVGEVVVPSSLVLVCGHGSRDACCAQRGTAVYGALVEALDPDQVWISSHQGGHRFAANVLVLPAGIQLGRVSTSRAADVVTRALAGRIDLAHYRGRTAYSADVQAAERAVREALGLGALGDLRLVSTDGDRVLFRDSEDLDHVARVERRPGPPVPASCGAAPEPQPVRIARLE